MIARLWSGAVRTPTPMSTPTTSGTPASPSTAGRPATAAPGCSAATTRASPSSSPSRCGTTSIAIRAFAGDDIEAAVLYPEDRRYLIDGASRVVHYEVADHAPPAA